MSKIETLIVKKLFESKTPYLIPMYQRNYAWDEGDITQLIQDILDYIPKKDEKPKPAKPYYIGTLVVYHREKNESHVFETIDGQQRLTTLSLLISYLKNEANIEDLKDNKLILNFESRENSQRSFSTIFSKNNYDNPDKRLRKEDLNSSILEGYQIIQKVLPLKIKEYDVKMEDFASFLLQYVTIMRVEVPKDTDLNHYFEIMNNRGEQLEKHEVLKSQLMEKLKDGEEQRFFHLIWESCSNMEKYIQTSFATKLRHKLFGEEDWGSFEVSDFSDFCEKVKTYEEEQKNEKNGKQQNEENKKDSIEESLTEIISKGSNGYNIQNREDGNPERFNSVINFSNFLLHVLRVYTGSNIALDDKQLISQFENNLLKEGEDKIKAFAYSLLKCKYLLDHYIIKREYSGEKDEWSLKRYKWYSDKNSEKANYVNTFGDEEIQEVSNKKILMLLAAFHVSTPTRVYKHWLNAVLYWLFKNDSKIKSVEYITYLESVGKAFVFDRYLSENELDYYDIIYNNKGQCKSSVDSLQSMDNLLIFGNIKNNLVFNFLDYLLWVNHVNGSNVDERIKNYEFTFRSSVEHYYPQNPLEGIQRLDENSLNSFGNLCLISHSKNSSLSNRLPTSKKEYYEKNPIDSIKQYVMMKVEKWDEIAIEDHFKEMKEVFLKCL